MMALFHRYSRFMKKAVSAVLLNAAYFVGIGPMALLFRLIGKKLLDIDLKQSTFQAVSGSDDIKRMY